MGITKANRLLYGYFQVIDHFFGRPNTFRLHNDSRRKLYKDLHRQLAENGEGKEILVERRKNLSQKDFRKKYLKNGIPVILDGAAKDWPCVKKWNLDYFNELHGEDEIVITGDNIREKAFEILRLKDLIENIKTGGTKYYRFYPLLSRHPEHIQDFDYKWLRSRKAKRSIGEFFQVFIGGKGTGTPMHNSTGGNLFTQVYGEKKFFLYPPNKTIIVDPEPGANLHRSAPYKSAAGPFDPFNPNYETPYTLFKYIDNYAAYLKPGDVLFNPPHYWHAVTNITDSIGVGYRWWSPLNSMKINFLYSFLDMCVIKPPVWKLHKMFGTDYNLLHLMETGNLEEYLSNKNAEK